jgi:hypothetical protein
LPAVGIRGSLRSLLLGAERGAPQRKNPAHARNPLAGTKDQWQLNSVGRRNSFVRLLGLDQKLRTPWENRATASRLPN